MVSFGGEAGPPFDCTPPARTYMESMPFTPMRWPSTCFIRPSWASGERLPRAFTKTVTSSGSWSRKNSVLCGVLPNHIAMPTMMASVTRTVRPGWRPSIEIVRAYQPMKPVISRGSPCSDFSISANCAASTAVRRPKIEPTAGVKIRATKIEAPSTKNRVSGR